MAYASRPVIVELALVLLVAGVLAFHGWTERRHAADRNRLVDALMARNAAEYVGLRAVDDAKPRPATRRLEDHDFQVGS